MATLFDWAKLALENKWIFILFISLITSIFGNTSQYMAITEKTQQIERTQEQVAAVANAMHENMTSQPQQNSQSQQKIIERHYYSNSGEAEKLIREHIRAMH